MKIMKLGWVIALSCLLNYSCQASGRAESPVSEDGHKKKLASSKSSHSEDEGFGDETSEESEGAAESPRFNADEIISEIQASTKRSYLKDRLFIKAELFKKIHGRDEGIIAKFKEEIAKLTLSPEGVTDAWSYTIEYYPTVNKVIAHISDPV